ncbi:helix-turn-helix domain-containing protein [Bifidobacterium simiiventris]|uniref:helix-turn-helix domain-containing protein n=1 Tax=Bifidobacterium simiiventris TaxID=2834434 RepID=UPI001C58722B|nr:helix-turn-helix transcriptional regulator [Bifidobacterium simiiventris]MBW3078234.1 helix-turn-helix transcriptional regulator [Bifidobacterium simiiventris]
MLFIANKMRAMPRITNPIDATGLQVAENIKRLRGSMQYKEVAEKLEAIGRPMTPVAIRDAENGKRRVDVDDLMAFAVVFDVSPLTLLLPDSGSTNIKASITGFPHDLGCERIWHWAEGERCLPSLTPETIERHIERDTRYQERAKPTVDERRSMSDDNLTEQPEEFAERAIKEFSTNRIVNNDVSDYIRWALTNGTLRFDRPDSNGR